MIVHKIANVVSRIKPGWCIRVSQDLMRQLEMMPFVHNGSEWSAADRVLENIVGSAYEFRYWVEPETGIVIFERLKQPLSGDTRTYVSPDRREHYTLGVDGLWRLKRE